MEPQQRFVGDYELFELIGKGSFATVWLGRHRLTGCPVAIKEYVFTVNDSLTIEVLATMRREIAIMQLLDHPFICDLFDVIESDVAGHLVMEYAEEGTLLDFANRRDSLLDEEDLRYFFVQIVCVLSYLHKEKRILHRDLKAENVLLDRHHNIKIIDFGLSNVLDGLSECLHTTCGSPAYVAPEMLLEQPYSEAADIWSAGVLLFALAARYLPFHDDNIGRLITKVLNEEPRYPVTVSAPLSDLLHRMLTKNPGNRITLDGIREHGWFCGPGVCRLAAVDRYRMSGPLDPDILEKLEVFGIDIRNIEQEFQAREFTAATVSYRALYHDKITDEMENLRNEMLLPPPDTSIASWPNLSPLGRKDLAVPFRRGSSNAVLNKVPSRGFSLAHLIAPTQSFRNVLKTRRVPVRKLAFVARSVPKPITGM
jgi:serine/threonine protein kinase